MPQNATPSRWKPSEGFPSHDDRRIAWKGVLPPGSGLLRRLVRLTGAANEDRAAHERTDRILRRTPPNRCEFDYDYYVALQGRRRAQRHHPCASR